MVQKTANSDLWISIDDRVLIADTTYSINKTFGGRKCNHRNGNFTNILNVWRQKTYSQCHKTTVPHSNFFLHRCPMVCSRPTERNALSKRSGLRTIFSTTNHHSILIILLKPTLHLDSNTAAIIITIAFNKFHRSHVEQQNCNGTKQS